MGRIVAQLKIINPLEKDKFIECSALVDTGASHLTLPMAWKHKLGQLDDYHQAEAEMASQETVSAELAGPVRIEIEGFGASYGEVLFVEMKPRGEDYEVLLGHLPLQYARIAVDMVGHRLLPVKYVDCKGNISLRTPASS